MILLCSEVISCTFYNDTKTYVNKQSIVQRMDVPIIVLSKSVCLSAHSHNMKKHWPSFNNVWYMFLLAGTGSGGTVICYLLSVLWMMS